MGLSHLWERWSQQQRTEREVPAIPSSSSTECTPKAWATCLHSSATGEPSTCSKRHHRHTTSEETIIPLTNVYFDKKVYMGETVLCGHRESSAVLSCSKEDHGVQVTGGNGPTVLLCPHCYRPDRAGWSQSSGATVKGPGEEVLSQGRGSTDDCLTSENRSRPVGRRYRDADFSWFK